MLDNPIVQALVLVSWGYCLGVITVFLYLFRSSRNIIWKSLVLIGTKIKKSDVTADVVWDVISDVINRIFKEVENEEHKETFKNKTQKEHK